MDPLTAGLALATEVFRARQQWWDSLSKDKRTELADKYADAEIRWLDFLESLRPK